MFEESIIVILYIHSYAESCLEFLYIMININQNLLYEFFPENNFVQLTH